MKLFTLVLAVLLICLAADNNQAFAAAAALMNGIMKWETRA